MKASKRIFFLTGWALFVGVNDGQSQDFSRFAHFPSPVIETAKKLIGVEHILLDVMCVDSSGKKLTLGLVGTASEGKRNQIFFLDQKGNIVRVSNWFDKLMETLGESVQFRYAKGHLFLAGVTKKSVLVGQETMSLAANPWNPSQLKRDFPSLDFHTLFGVVGYCPLYTVAEKSIYVLDMEGALSIFTEQGQLMEKHRLFSLKGGRKVSDEIFPWLDPIIGKMDGQIWIWDRARLRKYEIPSMDAIEVNLIELVSRMDKSEVRSSGDNIGISYYKKGDAFYLFSYTDKGISVYLHNQTSRSKKAIK